MNDGRYYRIWTGRDGVERRRACVVRDGVVIDLRKAQSRPLSDFDRLDGAWIWIGPLDERHTPYRAIGEMTPPSRDEALLVPGFVLEEG